jgi:hypothetical protein
MEVFKMKYYIFKTTQSDLLRLNGSKCKIIRKLTKRECDIEEVGIMYKIKFEDGETIDCFEDELRLV